MTTAPGSLAAAASAVASSAWAAGEAGGERQRGGEANGTQAGSHRGISGMFCEARMIVAAALSSVTGRVSTGSAWICPPNSNSCVPACDEAAARVERERLDVAVVRAQPHRRGRRARRSAASAAAISAPPRPAALRRRQQVQPRQLDGLAVGDAGRHLRAAHVRVADGRAVQRARPACARTACASQACDLVAREVLVGVVVDLARIADRAVGLAEGGARRGGRAGRRRRRWRGG